MIPTDTAATGTFKHDQGCGNEIQKTGLPDFGFRKKSGSTPLVNEIQTF